MRPERTMLARTRWLHGSRLAEANVAAIVLGDNVVVRMAKNGSGRDNDSKIITAGWALFG